MGTFIPQSSSLTSRPIFWRGRKEGLWFVLTFLEDIWGGAWNPREVEVPSEDVFKSFELDQEEALIQVASQFDTVSFATTNYEGVDCFRQQLDIRGSFLRVGYELY